jgi:hypothetical protein
VFTARYGLSVEIHSTFIAVEQANEQLQVTSVKCSDAACRTHNGLSTQHAAVPP